MKFIKNDCLKYSFSKAEKITGKKRIEELFKKGSSFYCGGFQVRYQSSDEAINYHRILISVPKRNFKRTVDRNLLKRRIREVYRLNKFLLLDSQSLYIGFIYLSEQIMTFHEIQNQLITCLKRLGSMNIESHE